MRTVDSEEMIISPQNTITMPQLRPLRDDLTIDASSKIIAFSFFILMAKQRFSLFWSILMTMFDDFLICIFRIKKCEMFLSLCDNFKFSKSEGDGFYLIGYFDLT